MEDVDTSDSKTVSSSISTKPVALGRKESIPAEDTDGYPSKDTDGIPTETTPLVGDSSQGLSGVFAWQKELLEEFGWELLGLLSCAQHVTKGFVHGFCMAAFAFIMKRYSVDASRMGIYQGVVQLPWALKPALGILSDACPIGGYTRKPYLIAATTIGVIALATLAVMRDALKVDQVVMLLFCCSLYASTVDLLTEAVYASALRAKPSHGPSLLSFVWGGMTVAGIAATLLSGGILSHTSPWVIYAVAIPFAGLIIVPIMLNWAKEPCLNREQISEQRARVWEQKMAVMLAFVMMAATAVLATSGMHFTIRQNAMVSAFVGSIVLMAFSVSLNPVIAKVNAFSLIQAATHVSLGGSSFYFMTDTKEQYPAGPHFTNEFYTISLPLCGAMFSLLGIYAYNRTAGAWTYRAMYMIGGLLGTIAALSDCVFFSRLNVSWGVNDHIFVLGSSSIQSVLGQWLWMPSVVLLSQLCPKGMEAIMYANLAGCHNLGNTLAANFGAALLEAGHVKPDGSKDEGHQFDNLWMVAFVAALMPLLSIVLVPWFIPNKLNTEKIFDDPNQPANEGSLLQQWGCDPKVDRTADSEDETAEDSRQQ